MDSPLRDIRCGAGAHTVGEAGDTERVLSLRGSRDAVTRLDPETPLYGAETMEDRVAESLSSERPAMVLLMVFGGVALLLAVVGIYGMLAFSVAQRRRELGIRRAVGSAPDGIFRLALTEGLRLPAPGHSLGGGSALRPLPGPGLRPPDELLQPTQEVIPAEGVVAEIDRAHEPRMDQGDLRAVPRRLQDPGDRL